MRAALQVLYGGTFDPVHAGHVAVAQAVSAAAQPDRFWFVPAALPPHRATPQVSAAQRMHMLELMLADQRRANTDTQSWGIDPCELRRADAGLASYTVDTLREKRARDPHTRFLWVLGWDALLGLPGWKEPEALLGLAALVVLPRANTPMPVDHPLQARWQQRQALTAESARSAANGSLLFCAMAEHPASATAIRAALQQDRTVSPSLSPSVAAYIERERLYRGTPENGGARTQD